MLVTTLDNEQIRWSPKGHRRAGVSTGHVNSLALIQELWPTVLILEEVSVPVRKRKTLYLDIYVPMMKTAIEFHGPQHYKYTPHFHRNIKEFMEGRKNDNEKKEWCELNGIRLIEFNDEDTAETMRTKLHEC